MKQENEQAIAAEKNKGPSKYPITSPRHAVGIFDVEQ